MWDEVTPPCPTSLSILAGQLGFPAPPTKNTGVLLPEMLNQDHREFCMGHLSR